ncbi:arrestin [Pochonia chlamydosporia 170]|uniref:Arrestin n=1 Tax=Pochonia chlamydosporia 170 TaxID=1380566 RepID=A0A179G068_METCM|nr:arrestin [Pochonia chlamydosporia 170]OAQ71285.1 arrestin [Pochonia chlamydosporia 170]
MVAGTGAGAALAGVRTNKNPVSQKPNIQVKIDRHFNSKVYTSGSTISGQAVVKTQKDTQFDDFDIIFSGIAATRLDFVQQYPSHSFRPFMKLRMPIDRSTLPDSHVFEAGKTYTIPFNFVVPHHLTIGACNHHCSSPAVRDQHLRLPPTVGFWEGDDQAPEMAQIEYSIKARAYRRAAEGGDAPNKIMEGYHILKVLPALPEDAPLDITFRDERYNLSKTKTIRKNLFSAKAGKLTATANQPSAVMLSADGHRASGSIARINLEFAPTATETAPPKINSVSGKIVTSTFFGAAPTDLLPNLGSRATYTANPSLSYTVSNNVFNNKTVEKLAWQMRNVSGRRDSGYSSLGNADEDQSETDSSDDATKKSKSCPIRHNATLDVPFSIPMSKKVFLPSFHSCLISRTYTLHLNLSVGPTNTALSLAIPLQIGVETIYEPQDGELPSFESVMAEDEQAASDGQLNARAIQFPELMEHTNSMLPGYEEISRRTVRVA